MPEGEGGGPAVVEVGSDSGGAPTPSRVGLDARGVLQLSQEIVLLIDKWKRLTYTQRSSPVENDNFWVITI
jgi:hypothetical protein